MCDRLEVKSSVLIWSTWSCLLSASDTVVGEIVSSIDRKKSITSQSVYDAVHPTWSSAHRCRLEERGGGRSPSKPQATMNSRCS